MASRSTFPTAVDNFIENTEILASELPALQRYQELKLKTNRPPAEDDELALLMQQLRGKLMTAEDYNHMKNSISTTQQFFRDEVDGYIKTKQEEFQNEVDKFSYQNEYNPTTQYRKKNTVTFNGESYINLKDSRGVAPNPLQNTDTWAKIAQRGAQGERGAAGTGLRFRGQWSGLVQFNTDDAVQFGGQIYAALQDNIGQEPNPSQDTIYWSLAVAKGQSTVVSTLKHSIVVSNTTQNVPIGILEYNSLTDSLLVIKNTATLAEGTNYKLNTNGRSIDSLEGMWDGTEYPLTFHFIVQKNMVSDLTFHDGSMIQNGTIKKEKLEPALKTEIDSKETTASVDSKIGILTGKVDTNKTEVETHKVDFVSHPANGGLTSGTATAYTCTSTTNPTVLTDKIGVMITVHVNSGANPTLKWGNNVAKLIKKANGQPALLKKDGLYTLRYNAVNDSFILQGEGGEDLTELITLTNEAERNEDAIRTNMAATVTSKGVPTASNAPWTVINNNVRNIDQNPPMGANGTSSVILNSGTTYYTMNVSDLGFRPTFVVVAWAQGTDMRRAQSFTSPVTQISTIMGSQGFVTQAYISEIVPNDDGCQIALTAGVSSAANGQVWSFNWWAYK